MKAVALDLPQTFTLKVVIRETHVGHNLEDVRDPVPPLNVFEYVIAKFNYYVFEEFERSWSYEAALRLAEMLREAGFKPMILTDIYIEDHVVYVRITDRLFAAITTPWERDPDLPVVHPIFIYALDEHSARLLELPWVAREVLYYYFRRCRYDQGGTKRTWWRIKEGLNEVELEIDLVKRRVKGKSRPVYVKTRLE